MKMFVPLLAAAAFAIAPASARTVTSGKSDDQRVTEGVSGPVEAAKPSKDKPQTDTTSETTRPDDTKAKKQKAQHPPPPPLHDPN